MDEDISCCSTSPSAGDRGASRPKRQMFEFGNYHAYYGKRKKSVAKADEKETSYPVTGVESDNQFSCKFPSDTRLSFFNSEWFAGKDVLDIGCNVGHVSLAIARDFHPRKIVGVDIDSHVINVARKNIKYYFRPGQKKQNISISFLVADYMPSSEMALKLVQPEFDAIVSLNVTKWIHLHGGDSGLQRFFRRCYLNLRQGGVFILEPQPFSSYTKRRKLSVKINETYNEINFKPDDFVNFLMKVGFSQMVFANKASCSFSSFSRLVCYKGNNPKKKVQALTLSEMNSTPDAENEVHRLEQHLRLLKEEYVRLQTRCAEYERKYDLLRTQFNAAGLTLPSGLEDSSDPNARQNNDSGTSFVSRLVGKVGDLFDNAMFSDLTIHLKQSSLKAHKFVLDVRSRNWGDLTTVDELDFRGLDNDVAYHLFQWVYTDKLPLTGNEALLVGLLKASRQYDLRTLSEKSERSLVSLVGLQNCIRLFQVAEQLQAPLLKDYCSELISTHWDKFSSEDFSLMSAASLYGILKEKSKFPLHTCIRLRREDIVFLYLVEFNSKLKEKLLELDEQGESPLAIALSTKQSTVASTLIAHGVDVNNYGKDGLTLLHKAAKAVDEFSAVFLLNNKASPNLTIQNTGQSVLHVLAEHDTASISGEQTEALERITELVLKQMTQVQSLAQKETKYGNTALHSAILAKNKPVFSLIVESKNVQLELVNGAGQTALALALTSMSESEKFFAEKLISRGASPDAVNPETGDTLAHAAADASNEESCLFLLDRGAKVDATNLRGLTVLHFAALRNLPRVTKRLLTGGVDVKAKTSEALSSSSNNITGQTALHLAIESRNRSIVQLFLENIEVTRPALSIRNSADQTPFALALWCGLHDYAKQMLVALSAGTGTVSSARSTSEAIINERNTSGLTLLHQAILFKDTKTAIFLVDNGADVSARTLQDQTPLELSIDCQLPAVVESLCRHNANPNDLRSNGVCPLWSALEKGQLTIAQQLINFGADRDFWHTGPEGSVQNLLHRAIDENNEPVAVFLVQNHCDANSPRRVGPNGEGADIARERSTPLHLAACWNLEQVVQALIERDAHINDQDIDGNTALHMAVDNQNQTVIRLLLSHPGLDLTVKNKAGDTAFVRAMTLRNHEAAQAMIDRNKDVTELPDSKGYTLLHQAIVKGDLESVLFLLSKQVNGNAKTNDHGYTAIHLAAIHGSELLLRHLLLTNVNIGAVTKQRQTALHLAAKAGKADILAVLLEKGLDPNAQDDQGNSVLHVAIIEGNLSVVELLLAESGRVNVSMQNGKGLTPFLCIGHHCKDNAAKIFEAFQFLIPDYNIDEEDEEENTAYMRGHAALCRALVNAGARLATVNRQNYSIFNFPVASKNLLYKLLDIIAKEPAWGNGEVCQECGNKFGLTTRKHHCRHCGRLLCAKCTAKEVPILKFGLGKPVRVCETCFDVISYRS